MLLVSPLGQPILVMSDAGGSNAASGVTLKFSDDALLSLPDESPLVSGTFRPSNYGAGQDTFAAPAPAGPYETALDILRGTDANGTWSLYVMDDTTGNAGNLAGGWSLEFDTLQGVHDLRLASTSSPNPVGTGSNGVCILSVSNAGPAAATAVLLTNVVPAGPISYFQLNSGST